MLVVTGIAVFCNDEKYNDLTETLDIPAPAAARCMYYSSWDRYIDRAHVRDVLKDCIRKGDGTPVQLEYLCCTKNMERYRQSVPAFRYNTAVFPPYGDTKHHWFIRTYNPNKLVSLITDSKEEILYCINNAFGFILHFVSLPDTSQ